MVQLGSVPHEPDGVSPDAALGGGVGGDFGDHGWFDLGQCDAVAAGVEAVRGDGVWPGMVACCGVRTAARERDWAVVSGTLRPAMMRVPLR